MRPEFQKMYEDLLKEKRKAFIKGIIYLIVELILCMAAFCYILYFYDIKLLGTFVLFSWFNNFTMNRHLDKIYRRK